MKAVRASDYGTADVLELEETAVPEPKADEVLIRVRAAGVNPADWKYRLGRYKQVMPLQFPWTPGLEGAGIVEATGPDATAFQAGQAVYGVLQGGYAEYALAKEKDIQPIPRGLSFEEAAAVPIGALTAWGAVIDAAKVEAGQQVLVQGGAGGVGAYAVQLAHWKEAHVIATASAANVEFVKSLGAERAIDYNAARFEDVLHDLDAVIDTVGGELAERSLKVLRRNGIYVTVVGRPAPEAGKAEGVRVTGTGRTPSGALRQISELIETRQLRPVVGRVFALSEAAQAQEMSEGGHGRGRIILRMPG